MAPPMRPILTMMLCSAFALTGSAALADRALVIANFAYPDAPANGALRQDAFRVSERLFGLGFTVSRLENPDAGRIDRALADLAADHGRVAIYYAGRMQGDDLQSVGGDTLSLPDMLVRAGVDGRDTTAVFLESCQTGAVASVALPEDAVEEVAATDEEVAAPLPDGVLLARAAKPCPEDGPHLTDILLDRLEIPGLAAAEIFADTDVVVQSSLSDALVFRRAVSGMRLTAADYRMLDSLSPEAQEQMLRLWSEAGIAIDRADAPSARVTPRPAAPRETVVLSQPVRPVSGGATLMPLRPTTNRVSDSVTVTPRGPVPVPAAAPAAVPGTGDLPQPYILIGFTAPSETSFGTATEPQGPVSGAAFAYDDLDSRRALRASDPDAFASLVQAGAFDPPPQEIVVALQTELLRMSCYNSTIDGQWGPGSRAAVGRYYEQIGGASPSQDPDVAIFRQIVLRDDVTCPAVQAPAPRPVATQPRASAPAAPAAPATPAPQPARPSRTINQSSGSGIFR